MNSDISFTLDEIIAEHEVYGSDLKPLLIFEGKTDVSVYYKLLAKSTVDISKIEIVVGGCKSKITKFHYDQNNKIKYLALLDLDHNGIFKKKLTDKNILYTHFYDMENYLTNIDVVHSTYEDFSDLRSNHFDKEQLLSEIINIIYPSILESEFKIKYLKKFSEKSKIYPTGIVNPKHKDFTNKDRIEQSNLVKKIILQYFTENEMDFDHSLWDETIKYVDIKLNSKSYLEVDEYIQTLLKGRILMDLQRIIFDMNFASVMKGKSKVAFITDLKKNIFKSDKCKLLLENIDNGLKAILS